MGDMTQDTGKDRGFFYFLVLYLVAAIVTVVGIYGGFTLGQMIGGSFLWFLFAVLGGFAGAAAVIGYSIAQSGGFRGGHALVSFVLAFTAIFVANGMLATNAVRTFPGLEVKNSYIASQEFNTRLHDQLDLGWQINADYADGRLILAITDEEGGAVRPSTLEAVVGRPTHVKDDVTPDFQFDGAAFVAAVPLGLGNWNIRMKATAEDGTEFIQRVVFRVKKES
jgi:nitrogen fixation protein FixH